MVDGRVALSGGLFDHGFGLSEASFDLCVGEGMAAGAAGVLRSIRVDANAGAVPADVDLGSVGVAGVLRAIGAGVYLRAVGIGGQAGSFIGVDGRSIDVGGDAESALVDDDCGAVGAGDVDALFADVDGVTTISQGDFGRWWRRSRRQRSDGSLLDADVLLGGVDADERAAFADGAGVGFAVGVVVALLFESEVVFEVAVGGFGLDGESGFFRQRDANGAVAVFDGDVADRRSAGDVDGAVAVGNGDVACDAIEGDIAIARGERQRPDELVGLKVGVGADLNLTVEAGEAQLGTAGVEADIAGDVLEVRGAEELAVDIGGAGDLGEGDIAGAALNGDGASDRMRGEGRVSVVDASEDRAGDAGDGDIAVVGGDVDGSLDGGDVDVSPVGEDGGGDGGRDGDGDVGAAALDGGKRDFNGVVERLDFGAELLGAGVGLGVGAGIDLLVDVDVDLIIVAGAGDGDITARIVDGNAVIGGQGLNQGLIALVFVAEELVHVVGIDSEVVAPDSVVKAVEGSADDAEEDEEEEDTSTKRTAAELGIIGVGIAVPSPLEQHDDTGRDEDGGPPAGVPAPEVHGGDASGLDEQEDDADGDQQ